MVVQLFRGDGLPVSGGDAPEPLEQQVLTALDNVGDRDWTDLGNLQRSDSNGAIQDVSGGLHVTDGISGLFGNADESGFADFDPYAASVSPEPSVARTSDLPQHEHLPVEPLGTEVNAETVHVDTNTALEVASRSIPTAAVEHVWEQGIWGVIFEGKSLLDVYKPFGDTLKRPIDTSISQSSEDAILPQSTKVKTTSHSGLTYHDVVRDRPDISWQEQRDADLQSSVKLWMALVNRWDSGCSLVTATLELGDTSRIFTMFAHLFSGRSAVTVKKRCYSVMRLCDYLENAGLSFPCSERAFYDFLCKEQLQKAPATRLKGYMQSINFVRHVMAVDELETLTSSARCKGACHGDVLHEKVQASPLKVTELRRIHELLYNCEDQWVCMFCGALLMAVYCRARWGDLMRAERVIMDYDREDTLQFLEARTGRHKTMRAQLHRHEFLPMVAPCHGVDGKNWGAVWLSVRAALHIAWPPDGFVMPAPGTQGQVTSRPLETQECAAWLRKLVKPDDPRSDRRISSHSLKSTFLSFAAKRGIGIPERLQLGYHTSSFQMGMVYSRDGAAASILVLEKLIEEIRNGTFDPDDTRSGRIKQTAQPVGPAGEAHVVHIKDEVEVVEVSDSDSSESSSPSTSSEEERPAFIKSRPVIQPVAAPEGFALWQHKKLKTLHLMLPENRKVFHCGRNAGPLHEMLAVAPEFDTPLCSLCFNRSRV